MLPLEEILNLPAFLIRRCNQIAIGVFLEETQGFDLTTAQWGALSLIAHEPGMDQTRLMERSALDRSSITKCVERLEAQGLILREVDPADKRARRLSVTKDGLALLDAMSDKVRDSQRRLLAPLGDEGADTFVKMLQILTAAHNEASRVPVRAPPASA
ncbi:MarR family transcriptional regulator [Rhizobium lusitanum]|uniref:DNA-binding MarR family transcriptional regulator n=1 Tax=Rhizobium lusitanum TaxID=293958 RepID=A0A7X0MDU0_9HYPH|nr:DNA-binding MarR family transcriptional regulator [Rhizobium lusitanum]